jgi:transposase InsO family protein
VLQALKAHDLITSPAFVVIKAAAEFRDKTTTPNQLWQTDFTYLKVIGWGWFYLSTILDDYSRYVIAWKLCTNMNTSDVTDTLELALGASGCDQVNVHHHQGCCRTMARVTSLCLSLVPTLDLALCLRLVWSATNMIHTVAIAIRSIGFCAKLLYEAIVATGASCW